MRTILLLLLASPIIAAEPAKFTVNVAKAEPPKALAEELRAALDPQAATISEADGTARARFWFRAETPARATAEQVANGLTYREIPEGTFLGVVEFAKPFTDFRKQELPAGAYSLRLAVQPDTGDHKDTAPHQDFCLLVPLADEKNLEPLETKETVKLSLKVTKADHPAVLLMFPYAGKELAPAVAAKPGGVTVIQTRRAVTAEGKAGTLGFAFVVDGASATR